MTLTQAAILARKAAFWAGVLVVLFVFFKIAIGVSTMVFRQFFPKPTPAPAVAFGKLPSIDLSKDNVDTSAGSTYVLQTIEGGLPNLGNQAKVFKVIKKPPTIIFGEEARKFAQALKFPAEPQSQSDNHYIFSDPVNPDRKLDLDVISGNFGLSNNVTKYPELLSKTGILSKDDTIRTAKSFLSRFEKLPKNLTDDQIFTIPLKIENGRLIEAKSISEAQVVRVGFKRGDLEKLPVLSFDSAKPDIWVEVTSLQDPDKQIFAASYFYYEPDLSLSSTYPVKPTQTAYDELIAGKGILVGQKSSQMIIRRISLTYVETLAQMDYFVPMYIFSGDNFSIFVPAIPAEWFKS